MPLPAPAAAIGGAILKYTGAAALWELGKRGVGWIASRFGRRAAQKAAQAMAQAGKQAINAKGAVGAAMEQIQARMRTLEQAIEAAKAAGDMRTARALEAQLARYAQAHAELAAVAQIGKERAVGNWISLASTAALVGFTVEEWRQASMFRENLGIMGELQDARLAVQREQIATQRAMIDAMMARLQGDERNRAFWAWYIQQKFALEQMRQQAAALKGQIYNARQAAGRRRGGQWDRQALSAVRAYENAVKVAQRAWLEWQKAYAAIAKENVRALNEQQAIALRGKWDAFLEALKAAYQQQEIAMRHVAEMQQIAFKGQWDMLKTAYDAQADMAKETHKAQLEAQLAWTKAEAEAAAERAKAEAKRQVIIEEGMWERLNEIGKQYGEAAKVSVAELYRRIREAEEAIKEGRQYEITLPVWTPTGTALVTVRTKGKRIKVDIDEKAKKVAMQYIKKIIVPKW